MDRAQSTHLEVVLAEAIEQLEHAQRMGQQEEIDAARGHVEIARERWVAQVAPLADVSAEVDSRFAALKARLAIRRGQEPDSAFRGLRAHEGQDVEPIGEMIEGVTGASRSPEVYADIVWLCRREIATAAALRLSELGVRLTGELNELDELSSEAVPQPARGGASASDQTERGLGSLGPGLLISRLLELGMGGLQFVLAYYGLSTLGIGLGFVVIGAISTVATLYVGSQILGQIAARWLPASSPGVWIALGCGFVLLTLLSYSVAALFVAGYAESVGGPVAAVVFLFSGAAYVLAFAFLSYRRSQDGSTVDGMRTSAAEPNPTSGQGSGHGRTAILALYASQARVVVAEAELQDAAFVRQAATAFAASFDGLSQPGPGIEVPDWVHRAEDEVNAKRWSSSVRASHSAHEGALADQGLG